MLKRNVSSKMLIANKNGGFEDGNKLIKKFAKLKTRKLSIFQKLVKFQNLSKSKNSLKLDAKKAGISFLTSGTSKICLLLIFIKALIL